MRFVLAFILACLTLPAAAQNEPSGSECTQAGPKRHADHQRQHLTAHQPCAGLLGLLRLCRTAALNGLTGLPPLAEDEASADHSPLEDETGGFVQIH